MLALRKMQQGAPISPSKPWNRPSSDLLGSNTSTLRTLARSCKFETRTDMQRARLTNSNTIHERRKNSLPSRCQAIIEMTQQSSTSERTGPPFHTKARACCGGLGTTI